MKIDREKLHLLHIRDATEKIIEYSKNLSFEEFAKLTKDYDAILMQIIVIGEAVNNLNDDFKEKHHDLPWYEATGLRNRIAHGYDDINPKVVWDTVKNDIPKLKEQIQKLI